MPQILQARLKQHVNKELPDVQAGFRKGRGTRDQIANSWWIIEKTREFQKNIYFCFIDYMKAFVWTTTNWKILKEIGISDHLICLLRNLHAGQEAPLGPYIEQWTGLKLGKEYDKAVYCHPVYLTYMQSTSCEMPGWEWQAGIKIARRNINNLRNADNTTLMAESKEELKSLLMKVK